MENQKIDRETLQTAIRRHFPNYDASVDYWEEQQRAWQEMVEREEAKAKERHRRYMLMEENIKLFFQEEGLYIRDPEGRITSEDLYGIYRQWCLDQQIPLHPPREFFLHAKNHAAEYRLVYTTYIPDRTGKRHRGFYGIRPLQEDEKSTTLL